MADRKDMYQPAPVGKPAGGTSELPNQQSIDLLIGLLQDYQRRTTQTTIPPEVERDIIIVNSVVDSIRTALALGVNPTTIGQVTPNVGSVAGGTSVVITGTRFLPGAKVRFGSEAASSVTVESQTQIRATTPAAQKTGPADVFVSTVGGAARKANGFTYHTT
jgi:hypothetical protein